MPPSAPESNRPNTLKNTNTNATSPTLLSPNSRDDEGRRVLRRRVVADRTLSQKDVSLLFLRVCKIPAPSTPGAVVLVTPLLAQTGQAASPKVEIRVRTLVLQTLVYAPSAPESNRPNTLKNTNTNATSPTLLTSEQPRRRGTPGSPTARRCRPNAFAERCIMTIPTRVQNPSAVGTRRSGFGDPFTRANGTGGVP